MEIGIYELFTSYEMEVETYAHVQIENQLGFNEQQFHAITSVEKLWDGSRNTCTCTNWKPTSISWTTNCMICMVWYVTMVWC